jgi:hypothetical protein
MEIEAIIGDRRDIFALILGRKAKIAPVISCAGRADGIGPARLSKVKVQ